MQITPYSLTLLERDIESEDPATVKEAAKRAVEMLRGAVESPKLVYVLMSDAFDEQPLECVFSTEQAAEDYKWKIMDRSGYDREISLWERQIDAPETVQQR